MILQARFSGTVQRLGPVTTRVVTEWVRAIPFEVWPQQDRVNGELRPAMVNDRAWYQFGVITNPLVERILAMTGGVELQRLLSVVMPGHGIDEHVDRQADRWLARVHVPLTEAPLARFLVEGEAHHLELGAAYLVNTLRKHAVENPDPHPRVHFMLDVGGPV